MAEPMTTYRWKNIKSRNGKIASPMSQEEDDRVARCEELAKTAWPQIRGPLTVALDGHLWTIRDESGAYELAHTDLERMEAALCCLAGVPTPREAKLGAQREWLISCIATVRAAALGDGGLSISAHLEIDMLTKQLVSLGLVPG